MSDIMIFFITNTPNSVPNRESETIMTEAHYIPLGDIWPQNLSKESQQAIRHAGYLVDLKQDHPAFMQDVNSYTIFAQTRRRTCPTPELWYHWNQTRRFLEDVLHMKDADIFPVAHWAWRTSLCIQNAEDDFTRQMHELSGVLINPNGGIIGYTTCALVNLTYGAEFGESILRPDTCADYGLDTNKPVPVGNGYWFAHPAIMYGQQVAHVRYVSVGM